MSLSKGNSVVNLTDTDPSNQSGSIWTGASNGSQWLISGFSARGTILSPIINLYDTSMNAVPYNLTLINSKMSTWWGGDIFTSSYGGKGNWLVAGLGSGCLPSFQPGCKSNQGGSTGCGNTTCDNHMALGLFNGSNFIDLSGATALAKEQADYILYASAWNGHFWLVGGGYGGGEILFKYNPSTDSFTFLTSSIRAATGASGSVTSIAWNGTDWLIGGEGFLAQYNGKAFISLTSNLNAALGSGFQLSGSNAVNKIVWNKASKLWVLGGGLAIALTGANRGWVASYKPGGAFTSLTVIPSSLKSGSLVLTLAYSGTTLVVGGYYTSSTNKGMLLLYNNATKTSRNLSDSLGSMGYVNWVGTS